MLGSDPEQVTVPLWVSLRHCNCLGGRSRSLSLTLSQEPHQQPSPTVLIYMRL